MQLKKRKREQVHAGSAVAWCRRSCEGRCTIWQDSAGSVVLHVVREVGEREKKISPNGESLECVKEFSYPGYLICRGGNASVDDVLRLRSEWRRHK